MQNQFYISHHGILGMKWGKRNGPPYPLGVGDHSASEKKAGWRKSLSGKKQKSPRGSQEETARRVSQQIKINTHGGVDLKAAGKIPEVKKAFQELSAAREEYRKAHKISEEYNNLSDDQLYDYKVRAFKEMNRKYGGFGDFKIPSRKDTRSVDYIFLMYEDWDQGWDSSYDIFCKDRGSSAEKEWDKEIKARDVYRQAQDKVVKDLLGEYGDMRIGGIRNDKTVEYVVSAALDEMRFDDEFNRKYYTNS